MAARKARAVARAIAQDGEALYSKFWLATVFAALALFTTAVLHGPI